MSASKRMFIQDRQRHPEQYGEPRPEKSPYTIEYVMEQMKPKTKRRKKCHEAIKQ